MHVNHWHKLFPFLKCTKRKYEIKKHDFLKGFDPFAPKQVSLKNVAMLLLSPYGAPSCHIF